MQEKLRQEVLRAYGVLPAEEGAKAETTGAEPSPDRPLRGDQETEANSDTNSGANSATPPAQPPPQRQPLLRPAAARPCSFGDRGTANIQPLRETPAGGISQAGAAGQGVPWRSEVSANGIGPVGLLPGEALVLAAEVPVIGGLLVDRPPQVQGLGNAQRPQDAGGIIGQLLRRIYVVLYLLKQSIAGNRLKRLAKVANRILWARYL